MVVKSAAELYMDFHHFHVSLESLFFTKPHTTLIHTDTRVLSTHACEKSCSHYVGNVDSVYPNNLEK